MYNPCTFSSAVLTLRTKGSLSFSFDDYCNLLYENFNKNPLPNSQCCSCCNCCSCCTSSFATATPWLSLKPTLRYGLRQSTLIQLSPCKRLIFGGRDRYYYRIPAHGLDYGCYEVSCSYKEKNGKEKIVRRRKGKLGRRVNLRERQCLSSAGDAEAVINLLSEEVTEEYLDDRNGNVGFSKKVELEKSSSYGGECKQRKKNVRLGLLESDSKSGFEVVTSEFRKEGRRREEEREERKECERKEERKEFTRKEEREGREERKNVARGENRRERKASSSFSSYYSVSSTGDFESDREAKDECVGLLEESSSGYEEKLWSGEDKFEGQVVGEFRSHGRGGQGKVLELGTSTTRTGAEWDLRKKSEKKLTEIDETQSRKEYSQLHSRIARTSDSDYEKVSSSHKQIDNKNEKLNLAVNFEKGTRKQYNQTGDQVTEQSQFRRNYLEDSNKQKIQGKNVQRTSQYEKQFNGREEILSVDVDLAAERSENCNTVGESTGKTDIRRNTLQLTTMSDNENVNTERVSNFQRPSVSRMKIHEEDRTLRSVEETNEKRHQRYEQITGQIESRRRTQKLSEISEVHYDNSRRTSTSQSEIGMKNQEGSTDVVYDSVEGGKEQRSHTGERASQIIQSRKGSQGVTNVSVVHASDRERVNASQITFEKRMTDRGSELTSVVKPIRETRERDNQTDENITQFKSGNDIRMPSEVSSFEEKTSQEASSSQASLNMVSNARMQQIDVEEGDYGNSQSIMIPPSPQVVGEPYGRDRKVDIYRELSKLQAPEDTMGSAHRLEESSMQFVGEFMEAARQELLTSEIRKEKGSDPNLVYEDEDKRKSSGKYGSIDLQLKEQDSKQSSGGSGVKGPSDEMWDVAEPSVQEPKETEAPESSTATKNTVVRRTGKSLWSIIADIVRLRWGSRSETSKSVKRSGGKSSSNDSVTSEVWFSGHEPEENRDKHVERERRSMSKEATSSHHLQLMQTSNQGQGEVSDTIGSKDMIRQLEGDTSSPSTILRSGSASKGIASPSEEDNLIWGQDGKSFSGTRSQDGKSLQFFSPSAEVGEISSVPLPSSGRSTPILEESYGRDRIDVPVSGSMELMEQSDSAKSAAVSGPDGKDGELKQRRLQRTKQVIRDRFDEWEEAYIHESEQRKVDEMFMREALLEAKKAADTWEVPVGAVLVQHGKIISRGYNLVEELRDSTAHAEMICIREASNNLRTWRLSETTLYVTLEPCPMCAGAILQARIDTLVWGAPNKLLGADGSWIRLFPNGGGNGLELADKPAAPVHPFHPKMTIRRGVMASECADVMQQFFQLRRRKKVKNEEDLPPKPSLPIASQHSKILHKMHDIFHSFLCL